VLATCHANQHPAWFLGGQVKSGVVQLSEAGVISVVSVCDEDLSSGCGAVQARYTIVMRAQARVHPCV
jgi:hypothetical protein